MRAHLHRRTAAPGADTVIIQENTDRLNDDTVRIVTPADKGRNIRPAGNDFARGQRMVAAGDRLSSRHIGMMAAANIARVTVSRKPRVALLSTGDELVTVGDPVGPDQIVSSNNLLLSTLIEEHGGQAVDLGIAKDSRTSLEEKIALLKSIDAIDLFVTIGGARSVIMTWCRRCSASTGLRSISGKSPSARANR